MIYQDKHAKCLVCKKIGCDLDHIKTRKSGGTDEYWNFLPLCRQHHTERHKIGLQSFAKKYASVKEFLILNDWEQCPLSGKWLHCKSIS